MEHHPTVGRRVVLVGLGALAAGGVRAQSAYPSRPVRLIVGYGPASGADVVARLIGTKLAETLGQGFVVENKPGAGGVIATQDFVRARPDGYTLLLAAMPHILLSYATQSRLPYHPLKDLLPVAQISSVDLVLVINPQKVPAQTLAEFMDHARKQPETFFGTPGVGTVGHFLATMFADAAKAKVEPVHYKTTGDSVTALLAGDIHALFVTYTVADALTKAGKFRALAVTSATRARHFPNAPTMREQGFPALEAGSWYGIFAPGGTPLDILDRLSSEVVKITRGSDTSAKLDEAGMTVTALDRHAFGRGLEEDLARWQRVVAATGFRTQE